MRYIMFTIMWSLPAIALFCGSAYLAATSTIVQWFALVAALPLVYAAGMVTRAVVRR